MDVQAQTGWMYKFKQGDVQVQTRWMYKHKQGGCKSTNRVGVQMQTWWIYKLNQGGCTSTNRVDVQEQIPHSKYERTCLRYGAMTVRQPRLPINAIHIPKNRQRSQLLDNHRQSWKCRHADWFIGLRLVIWLLPKGGVE